TLPRAPTRAPNRAAGLAPSPLGRGERGAPARRPDPRPLAGRGVAGAGRTVSVPRRRAAPYGGHCGASEDGGPPGEPDAVGRGPRAGARAGRGACVFDLLPPDQPGRTA